MISARHTVEESLRQVEDRAAMLRFFADSIRDTDIVPDAAVFSGLADDLGEIQTIACAVRRALGADALSIEIGAGRNRRRR